METIPRDVRFTPNNGHSPDGLSRPLCVNSRHRAGDPWRGYAFIDLELTGTVTKVDLSTPGLLLLRMQDQLLYSPVQ
jgi:hypothetical protein